MMNRSDFLGSAAILSLLVLGALSFMPIGLAPPLESPSPAVTTPEPGDAEGWAPWLEGRLRPAPARIARPLAPVDELAGYSLVGLVEVDGRTLAVIAGNGGTHSLAVGGMLDGYEATAIETDHIVFERDGNQVTLRLAR
ncbi:hypothetical protein [Maricaulis sp.]|uniref:hypothetical protein n=1 Tax=Maricaulis sp. TaxID=1486257 RepID=UPI003A91EA9E